MLKRVFVIAAALLIAAVQAELPVSGASTCTVQYYYTSSQNPEPVPGATKGSQSGTKWKIRPAGTARTEYKEQKHGKTITYTFDGWYLNMNCIGTKYRPGKDITVSSSETVSGGSAICLSEDRRTVRIATVLPPPLLPEPIPGVDVFNPAFDVTPAHLVTKIITERGVYAPNELRHAFAH